MLGRAANAGCTVLRDLQQKQNGPASSTVLTSLTLQEQYEICRLTVNLSCHAVVLVHRDFPQHIKMIQYIKTFAVGVSFQAILPYTRSVQPESASTLRCISNTILLFALSAVLGWRCQNKQCLRDAQRVRGCAHVHWVCVASSPATPVKF